MPSRYYQRNFVKAFYYHIYNRGSYKNDFFLDSEDYTTFLEIIEYYLRFPQGKPLSWKTRYKDDKPNIKVPNLDVKSTITIVCFCLMPNHFHLLIRQKYNPNKENGITNFMRRLCITYAMYFNEKHDHSGNLFQGKYKNVVVKSDNRLLYLTKYIHQNPFEILTKGQKLQDFKYSSYPTYLGLENDKSWVDKVTVLRLLSQDNQINKYKQFVEKAPQKESLIENAAIDNTP